MPFNAIKIDTAPNYLVKGIIPRGGLIVIWGPPKCGKSFWTFDLMMHVALGWKYRGRRVRQGAVVYLALEGGNGFRARVEAWRQRHLSDHQGEVPFYLISTSIDLVKDHAALIAAIRAELGNVKPDAVVIDTLNRALSATRTPARTWRNSSGPPTPSEPRSAAPPSSSTTAAFRAPGRAATPV